jgi:hypothetical protein
MENVELLQKYFGFDDSDLFANRNGNLTPRQQSRLVDDDKFGKKLFLIIGLILLFVAFLPAIIIGITLTLCITKNCWPVSARYFFSGMVVIWTPIWGYFGIRVLRSALSTPKPFSLQMVEGPINIVRTVRTDFKTRQELEAHELHIGNEEFDCNSELANIMMQGDNYSIYYIKESKKIISAEMSAKGN